MPVHLSVGCCLNIPCVITVYGKFNVLWVTGAIRLEDSKPSARGSEHVEVPFDAWPKAENVENPFTFRKAGYEFMYPEHPQNDFMLDDPNNCYVRALGLDYIFGLMSDVESDGDY